MIPAGYTYTRCDIYTAHEFAEMFARIPEIVNAYIAENPKEIYNTDDQIAVRHKADEHFIGNGNNSARHGYANGNGGRTTKRWDYPEDSRHSQ
jgi:hypothetical protein